MWQVDEGKERALIIHKGFGTDYARTQYIPVGIYTIVEVSPVKDRPLAGDG